MASLRILYDCRLSVVCANVSCMRTSGARYKLATLSPEKTGRYVTKCPNEADMYRVSSF